MEDDFYHYVVLGTGLQQCIASSELSNKHKKVLHLDTESTYGSDLRSLNYTDLTLLTSKPPKKELLSLSTQFNIDLTPKFLLASGKMINLLIKHNMQDLFDFTIVSGNFLFHKNLHLIPSSESSSLKSNLIGWMQKPFLVKFFWKVRKYGEGKDVSFKKTMREEFESFGLNEKSIDVVGHAIGLNLDEGYLDRSPSETYDSICEYVRSLAVLGGESPFLYPHYGLSEFCQAFSRRAGLAGCTFMMNTPVLAIYDGDDNLLEDNSNVRNEDGKNANSKEKKDNRNVRNEDGKNEDNSNDNKDNRNTGSGKRKVNSKEKKDNSKEKRDNSKEKKDNINVIIEGNKVNSKEQKDNKVNSKEEKNFTVIENNGEVCEDGYTDASGEYEIEQSDLAYQSSSDLRNSTASLQNKKTIETLYSEKEVNRSSDIKTNQEVIDFVDKNKEDNAIHSLENLSINKQESNNSWKYKIVIKDNINNCTKNIMTNCIVSDPSYFKNSTKTVFEILTKILIVKGDIKLLPPKHRNKANHITFLGKELGRKNDIFVAILGHGENVCPDGYKIVIINTVKEGENDQTSIVKIKDVLDFDHLMDEFTIDKEYKTRKAENKSLIICDSVDQTTHFESLYESSMKVLKLLDETYEDDIL